MTSAKQSRSQGIRPIVMKSAGCCFEVVGPAGAFAQKVTVWHFILLQIAIKKAQRNHDFNFIRTLETVILCSNAPAGPDHKRIPLSD
jgi:hypothetical protein